MPVKSGDTVTLHYVGTLDDGEEFARSPADKPLVFQLGQGMLIPGFEDAVLAYGKGDAFSVTISPDQAYGLHDPQLVFQVPSDHVPANFDPAPGMLLHVSTDQGELEVKVLDVDSHSITLDANHPLAGQTLTFAVTITDVDDN